MKKIILAVALGEIALASLVALVGECKAHKKYIKGWNDGVAFGCAVKDLEYTIKEITDDRKRK